MKHDDLPRQARDKRKENSPKQRTCARFTQATITDGATGASVATSTSAAASIPPCAGPGPCATMMVNTSR